jgi:hypothetical protein
MLIRAQPRSRRPLDAANMSWMSEDETKIDRQVHSDTFEVTPPTAIRPSTFWSTSIRSTAASSIRQHLAAGGPDQQLCQSPSNCSRPNPDPARGRYCGRCGHHLHHQVLGSDGGFTSPIPPASSRQRRDSQTCRRVVVFGPPLSTSLKTGTNAFDATHRLPWRR